MRRINAGLFVSLDGVVEARGIGMSGSSTLVSWLLRNGLLDELHLLVFPVVIGGGKRLFGEPDGQVPLTLAGSESFGTGVVHLSYEPAG